MQTGTAVNKSQNTFSDFPTCVKKGLNNDYQLWLAKNKTIDNIRKTEAKNGQENKMQNGLDVTKKEFF